jgi:hypothetical protein
MRWGEVIRRAAVRFRLIPDVLERDEGKKELVEWAGKHSDLGGSGAGEEDRVKMPEKQRPGPAS